MLAAGVQQDKSELDFLTLWRSICGENRDKKYMVTKKVTRSVLGQTCCLCPGPLSPDYGRNQGLIKDGDLEILHLPKEQCTIPTRNPGEGNGDPLQHSCLENPMDGGA